MDNYKLGFGKDGIATILQNELNKHFEEYNVYHSSPEGLMHYIIEFVVIRRESLKGSVYRHRFYERDFNGSLANAKEQFAIAIKKILADINDKSPE